MFGSRTDMRLAYFLSDTGVKTDKQERRCQRQLVCSFFINIFGLF